MPTADASAPDVTSLAGIKVLVVEDDYFVANDCAAELRAHGALVLGPVPDAGRARAFLAGEQPDCVLLDINLKGDLVFDLAQGFMARRIPMIFTTGYDATILPAALRGTPCLQKPVESQALVRMILLETEPRRTA